MPEHYERESSLSLLPTNLCSPGSFTSSLHSDIWVQQPTRAHSRPCGIQRTKLPCETETKLDTGLCSGLAEATAERVPWRERQTCDTAAACYFHPNKSATPQTPMSAPEKCFSQGPEKGHDVHQQHEGPSGSLGSHLLHLVLPHPPQHCGKVFSGNKAILSGLGEMHFPTDILIDTIKRNRFERINSLVLIEPVKAREKS